MVLSSLLLLLLLLLFLCQVQISESCKCREPPEHIRFEFPNPLQPIMTNTVQRSSKSHATFYDNNSSAGITLRRTTKFIRFEDYLPDLLARNNSLRALAVTHLQLSWTVIESFGHFSLLQYANINLNPTKSVLLSAFVRTLAKLEHLNSVTLSFGDEYERSKTSILEGKAQGYWYPDIDDRHEKSDPGYHHALLELLTARRSTLRSLTLDRAFADPAPLFFTEFVSHMRHLETLQLTNNYLSAENVLSIFDTELPDLRVLNLFRNRFDFVGLIAPGLGQKQLRMPKLELLDLSDNKIGIYFAKSILRSHLPSLQEIDLSWGHISEHQEPEIDCVLCAVPPTLAILGAAHNDLKYFPRALMKQLAANRGQSSLESWWKTMGYPGVCHNNWIFDPSLVTELCPNDHSDENAKDGRRNPCRFPSKCPEIHISDCGFPYGCDDKGYDF